MSDTKPSEAALSAAAIIMATQSGERGPILKNAIAVIIERETKAGLLAERLAELLSAVTSPCAPDSRNPICWSGSPSQNEGMYRAINKARALLAKLKA